MDVPFFHPETYRTKKCTMDDVTVTFRAYEGLDYCAAPADPIQKLNLYVPKDITPEQCTTDTRCILHPSFCPTP